MDILRSGICASYWFICKMAYIVLISSSCFICSSIIEGGGSDLSHCSVNHTRCNIKAPIVGTFYQSPNPNSPVFVKKEDRVNNDIIVCIREAMKVMNEIHAECSGEILEILGTNGCPVEYGQALFKIKLDTV